MNGFSKIFIIANVSILTKSKFVSSTIHTYKYMMIKSSCQGAWFQKVKNR